MDVVPRYPHLNGLDLKCVPMALEETLDLENEIEEPAPPFLFALFEPQSTSQALTNGEMSNGIK
jgi:hypothetical protein